MNDNVLRPKQFFSNGERVKYDDPEIGNGFGIIMDFNTTISPVKVVLNVGKSEPILVRPMYVYKADDNSSPDGWTFTIPALQN